MSSFHIYLYGPHTGPFETSFEASSARLQDLDQLLIEPDGSFVWTDRCDQQVDGMLYDAAGKLQYVELRGECRRGTWRRILIAIAGDQTELLEVMSLPNRRLQNLQSFEESTWADEPID